MGNFNIDRSGDPLYQAFVCTGLTPAPEHLNLPKTIFDDSQNRHFSPDRTLTTNELSWRISDHLPSLGELLSPRAVVGPFVEWAHREITTGTVLG